MNVIEEIKRINELELRNGTVNTNASWHRQYANSAWVFVGGLDSKLTEGDVVCIMSQFGEVEDVNLVRDEATGDSKGFAFLKYEDARSCVLAVDNLCGTKVLERSLRVDHVENYRLPKHLQENEEQIHTGAGHAYQDQELASDFNIQKGQDLFAAPSDQAKQARKEERRRQREERHVRRREREARRAERDLESRRGRDQESRRRQSTREHRHKRGHTSARRSSRSSSNSTTSTSRKHRKRRFDLKDDLEYKR